MLNVIMHSFEGVINSQPRYNCYHILEINLAISNKCFKAWTLRSSNSIIRHYSHYFTHKTTLGCLDWSGCMGLQWQCYL